MNAISVEAVRDGQAIIRLNGVTELPRSTSFRIEPIDDTNDPGQIQGWPRGDLAPQSARVGERGVELLIGPEVVDAPSLRPGTPVVISVPGARVRSELRWPNLPVSKVRRRGAPVVTGAQRIADMSARAEQQRAELARIRAARIEAEKEQEEAALALLASRRMSAGEARAERVPSIPLEKVAEVIAAAVDPAMKQANGAAAPSAPTVARMPSQPGDLTPPPLPPAVSPAGVGNAATASPENLQGEAEAAARGESPESVTATRRAPRGAAPDLPALAPVAPLAPHAPLAQLAPLPPDMRSVAAPISVQSPTGDIGPGQTPKQQMAVEAPLDERPAHEVLARQVATREAPPPARSTALMQIFGVGFVVALGLAGLATYLVPTIESANRAADTSAMDLLRSEASDLRKRLANEAARQKAAIEAEEARARANAARVEEAQSALAEERRKAAAAEAAAREAEDVMKRLANEADALRRGTAAAGDTKPGATDAAASAQVTLKVVGSEFQITGQLESFDGKTYVIQSQNVGSLSFDADRVQCSGTACPRL